MKIGELARAAGTQVETIRFYEREGLLPRAARSGANYRVYDPSHVARLAFIRHCRCLDMTLDEIRVLLRHRDQPAADCGDVDRLVEAHLGHVRGRIRELRQLERSLRELRLRCVPGAPGPACGIVEGLEHAALAHDHSAAKDGQAGHVPGTHGRPRRDRFPPGQGG